MRTKRIDVGFRLAQLADPLFECRGWIAGADGGGAAENLGTILTLHADSGVSRIVLGLRHQRTDLVALEAGVAVVRRK